MRYKYFKESMTTFIYILGEKSTIVQSSTVAIKSSTSGWVRLGLHWELTCFLKRRPDVSWLYGRNKRLRLLNDALSIGSVTVLRSTITQSSFCRLRKNVCSLKFEVPPLAVECAELRLDEVVEEGELKGEGGWRSPSGLPAVFSPSPTTGL